MAEIVVTIVALLALVQPHVYIGDVAGDHIGNHVIVSTSVGCVVQYGDADGYQSVHASTRRCELP